MTYVPKHRGEPKTKWVVTWVESERGWGSNSWTEEFDNKEEAEANFESGRPKDGPTPDYYIIATNIKEIKA